MTQKQLEREIRRITGDSRQAISRLGFQLQRTGRPRPQLAPIKSLPRR